MVSDVGFEPAFPLGFSLSNESFWLKFNIKHSERPERVLKL